MNNEKKLIKNSSVIIVMFSFIYIAGGYILEKYFNLLYRHWVFNFITIIWIIYFLIIQNVILIKLNSILKEKFFFKKIWKAIIQIICIGLICLINFYAIFGCLFVMGIKYEEIGVETYKGERYVVRNTAKWLDNYPKYYYHPYKNLFVYGKDIKYSGEVKWEDYSEIETDNKKESDPIPNIPEEDTDVVVEDEEIKIIATNIRYIQKVDDDLHYGFYLIDQAAHQYLYGFVQSNNDSVSWEMIYQFPANSEMYYGHFLDRELGFINFGSSEGLSLLMTNDGGLTWEKVLINLPEENENMLYVQDIKKDEEEIQLILGVPSWSNSNQSIKYISVDKGLSWELQM